MCLAGPAWSGAGVAAFEVEALGRCLGALEDVQPAPNGNGLRSGETDGFDWCAFTVHPRKSAAVRARFEEWVAEMKALDRYRPSVDVLGGFESHLWREPVLLVELRDNGRELTFHATEIDKEG